MTSEFTMTTGATLVDLSDVGILAVSGADSVQFLQGQLSIDVAQLNSQASSLAAYCSPQGRILALLRILYVGSTLCLVMPVERVETIARRLRMFVLAADVSITVPKQPALLVRGLFGGQGLPNQPNATCSEQGFTVARIGTEDRYLLIGAGADLQAFEQRTQAPVLHADNARWRHAEIRAGLPAVFDATADLFIPQMVNLDKLGAIDFKKGCYVGQEVVARTQYLGKLKRRLYRLIGDATTVPVPGTKLRPGSDSDSSVGQVVEASRDSSNRVIGLAVIVSAAAQAPLFLPGDDKPLQVEPVETEA